jgi:hypothetical protein
MHEKSKSSKKNYFVATVLLLVLIVSLSMYVKSVSFSQSPLITNEGAVYTFNDLTCSWASSADTIETNVSWFNGSTLFSTTIVLGNISVLDDQ